MKTLIIGGTSGLGLALAQEESKTREVWVTGRRDPGVDGTTFERLDIGAGDDFIVAIDELVNKIGVVDTVVYAAGFFQDGTMTDLTVDDVQKMMNVGVTAAIALTKKLLDSQGKLSEFIAITSTSQWTPRLYEPVYTAAKAALGAYAHSLSIDERVECTIVAGPAGMVTNFWKETNPNEHDQTEMLDPSWVSGEIQKLRSMHKTYLFAKILRQPARVEIVEQN